MNQEFIKQRVAVLGYGAEGQALCHYLLDQGQEELVICDQATKLDLGLNQPTVHWQLGPDYLAGLARFELILRSPGIPPFLPEIKAAVAKGSKLSSLTKLFFAHCPAPIIAVTGSNGKTTTSALIAHLLRENLAELPFRQVWEGGNDQEPLLAQLDQINAEDVVVLELSSFQLYDLEVSPHLAVITNFSPNHLNWHPDMQDYAQAKSNIFRHQQAGDYCLFNAKDKGGKYFVDEDTKGTRLFYQDPKIALNALPYLTHPANLAAVELVAQLVGLSEAQTKQGLLSFVPPVQRLELVATVAGVTYYNDSASTTPESTASSLTLCKQIAKDVILIAGGKNKGMSYDALVEAIKEQQPKQLLLIGEVAPSLAQAVAIAAIEQDSKICSSLEETMQLVAKLAKSGDLVLFSPGFASFDMFKNSKERGKIFSQLVQDLKLAPTCKNC